jgi:hypothetical protein
MRTFNVNDRVIVLKEGDRNNNKHGFIESIMEMNHICVTIYNIEFEFGGIP